MLSELWQVVWKEKGEQMKLGELNQYQSICREITELNVMMKDKTVRSIVNGSDSAFPYLQHKIEVSGIEDTNVGETMLARIQKLEERKSYIESFVEGIEDSLTRRIFRFRFINGFSWVRTALKIGGDNTAASVKMICYRYLKEKHN